MNCKTCDKSVDNELVEMCGNCVEKKQPNGKFTDYTYRPIGWSPKNKDKVTTKSD